mgnify:CR=1 FL=1
MKKLFVLVCLLAIGFCNVAWAAKRQAKHVASITPEKKEKKQLII